MSPHRLRRGALHLPARRSRQNANLILARALSTFFLDAVYRPILDRLEGLKNKLDADGRGSGRMGPFAPSRTGPSCLSHQAKSSIVVAASNPRLFSVHPRYYVFSSSIHGLLLARVDRTLHTIGRLRRRSARIRQARLVVPVSFDREWPIETGTTSLACLTFLPAPPIPNPRSAGNAPFPQQVKA